MITPSHIFFQLSQDVSALSLPLEKHLQIHYFSFKRTYTDGSKIYLFNHPSYYQHWFEKEYYLIGNREGKPSNYENGYDLWEYLPDPYNLYQEGAENFNIAHGLTITRKHDDYCDFFFFATNNENSLIKRLYFDRKDLFEKYCDYFLDASESIVRRAKSSKIVLPFSSKLVTPESTLDIDSFLREIRSRSGNRLKELTVREVECAFYLAEGKSYKEIAIILGDLSPRTIEEHAFNIRQKLQCKNKSELISFLCKRFTNLSITHN